MRTIIAATDFSPASLNAVDYATNLAMSIHANLLLVHVIELPVSEVPLSGECYNTMMDEAKQQLFKLQDKLVKYAKNTIEIETYIGAGTLLVELSKLCTLHEPFAIVMGTEERGIIEKIFVGNSTRMAAKDLHYAMLVVPATVAFKQVNKVCLATDLKDIYDLPLQHIKEIVVALHAKLDIVHICKNEEERSKQRLASLLVKEKFKDLHPKMHFIINKNIDAAIDAFAMEQKDDIIFILPKKRAFIDAVFHKSHAKSISTHPALPVMNIN